MSSNVTLVKELYEHFAKKDNDSIRALFQDDIVWVQMKGFPDGGRFEGADEIFHNVFQNFRDNWIQWETIVDEYLEAENSVLVIGRYEGGYRVTGKSVSAEFVHRYQFRDDKIAKFTQYTDTLLIHQAMQD
ncbi:nuclear transport factor 2 family protein [Fulvivirga sp. 29W222]|uniref:Nuclear transport factor 2 family protein n=1 Tax=Fulvivirga marina TaxID=2494733 RepID=A0A937KAW8_9BACT|nr:nuclear transport factor 2 family protein [Fulvivirga marina]MBL6445187.1 nuclear transport factor 2 family protein [Fulvivirga marina]